MRSVVFASVAKKDFDECARINRKMFIKINELIFDIDRHPYAGLGKPEPLKHELSGFWSRRINNKDRLVYRISPQNEIIIISCKGHYR
ncbi:MAG: Txe/YoeB family addiction module toxin [Bacteroidia bacterium]|nr:Txe/YoeB family addiction module toxin [Bacteroidia bacterium]